MARMELDPPETQAGRHAMLKEFKEALSPSDPKVRRLMNGVMFTDTPELHLARGGEWSAITDKQLAAVVALAKRGLENDPEYRNSVEQSSSLSDDVRTQALVDKARLLEEAIKQVAEELNWRDVRPATVFDTSWQPERRVQAQEPKVKGGPGQRVEHVQRRALRKAAEAANAGENKATIAKILTDAGVALPLSEQMKADLRRLQGAASGSAR